MTDNETILWQRFMQSKGIMNNFTYLYDAHKFDKRSMEEYLEDVQAEDVILNAFDFTGAGNTIFGFKYWKDMDAKWQVKLAEFRKEGSIDIPEEQIRCPHCGRLRPRSAFTVGSKGQLHKHCKECEGGFWDKQRKEREKEEKEREKLEKERRQLEKEIGEKMAKLDRLTAKVDAPAQADESDVEDQSVVTDAPMRSDALVAPKLGEYDATLHYKTTQKSITFNAVLSAKIQEGQFTKCYLNSDKLHRQFLIFNRVEGANVTSASSRASMLVQVCSADICRSLAARFNLEVGDNYYLHITKDLAPKADVITIEILKVRTRDEYVKLAQHREEAERDGKPMPGEDVSEYHEREEPIAEQSEQEDRPLIAFGDIAPAPNKTNVTPDDVLQAAIDKGILTEHDIAAFLCRKGWELHEPVVVTKLKKFSI